MRSREEQDDKAMSRTPGGNHAKKNGEQICEALKLEIYNSTPSGNGFRQSSNQVLGHTKAARIHFQQSRTRRGIQGNHQERVSGGNVDLNRVIKLYRNTGALMHLGFSVAAATKGRRAEMDTALSTLPRHRRYVPVLC